MPTLTRDELYTLVWSEPIQKIAPRYNISDRGLGKLCARHGTPVPPRGWWARKRAGQRVRRIPLPPANGRSSMIAIEAQQAPAPVEPPPPPPPLAPEIAFERDPVNAIFVDENAKVTHPLVKDAAAELRTGRADRDGIIRTPRGCVDVRVSKGSVSRALRILQALFKALESRGYTVAIKDGSSRRQFEPKVDGFRALTHVENQPLATTRTAPSCRREPTRPSTVSDSSRRRGPLTS